MNRKIDWIIGFPLGIALGMYLGFHWAERKCSARTIYQTADDGLAIATHLRAGKPQFALAEAENNIRFGLRSLPFLKSSSVDEPWASGRAQLLADLQRYDELYLKAHEPFFPFRSPVEPPKK